MEAVTNTSSFTDKRTEAPAVKKRPKNTQLSSGRAEIQTLPEFDPSSTS